MSDDGMQFFRELTAARNRATPFLEQCMLAAGDDNEKLVELIMDAVLEDASLLDAFTEIGEKMTIWDLQAAEADRRKAE